MGPDLLSPLRNRFFFDMEKPVGVVVLCSTLRLGLCYPGTSLGVCAPSPHPGHELGWPWQGLKLTYPKPLRLRGLRDLSLDSIYQLWEPRKTVPVSSPGSSSVDA